MAETGELGIVQTEPAFEEQQRFKAAVNHIIADAVGARHDLELLTREMQQTRSRLPVALSPTQDTPPPESEYGLVGSSQLNREVREHVRKAARAGTDVLIWGETGTGKELVAAAIHKASPRKAGPYVSINCGALDENLLLDALFGHVRGAFTEAKNDRKGAFLAAHGGTLHLDEIANSSLKVQQALLRALSVRRILPLGADQEQAFDTRVVAATNVDLRDCVRAGAFREDLYYRLAVISIETPPLRHRKDDIPELAAFCIHDAAGAIGRQEARLSRGALDLMYAYDWPGNVRELKNCLIRAMAFVEDDLILPQHISLELDAYRTYSKPLPPEVLAEKIHPGAPVFQPRSLLRDLSLPSAREDAGPAPAGNPAGSAVSAAIVAEIGHASEYLWPAPPRDAFTPAREASAGSAGASGAGGADHGTGKDALPGAPSGSETGGLLATSAPLSAPTFPKVAQSSAAATFPLNQAAGRANRSAKPSSPSPADEVWLFSGAARPPEADIPPLGAPVGVVPPAVARRAAGRQAAYQLAATRLAAGRQSGETARQADAARGTSPVGARAEGGGAGGLNERQARALAFVREHGEITRSVYEGIVGRDVSARTAQNDLRELIDRGILKRVGAGPGTRYVPARIL
jgi:DNA-binding NtrC family response regulator